MQPIFLTPRLILYCLFNRARLVYNDYLTVLEHLYINEPKMERRVLFFVFQSTSTFHNWGMNFWVSTHEIKPDNLQNVRFFLEQNVRLLYKGALAKSMFWGKFIYLKKTLYF